MSKRTASSPTSVSEDASASKKPKLEIVNDLEAMALEEAKLYPTAELRNAALVAIGIPDGTKYEDAQVKDHKAAGTHVSAKEKDLPLVAAVFPRPAARCFSRCAHLSLPLTPPTPQRLVLPAALSR